jgi:glyoxylase-like metal-dependent hydrolase (beta-lactamase superfamily II)
MQAGIHDIDESRMAHGMGMGTRIAMPVLMFLIEHPAGRVLFETGYDPDDPDGLLIPGDEADPANAIVPQLDRLGLTPDDIDYVVLSCLYYDHAGGLQHFPNSKIVVQREEVEEWRRPTRARRFIVKEVYPNKSLEPAKGFDFVYPDADEYDLFGDGVVTVIRAPCHARGEQAVMVRLPNTGTVMLPGGVLPLAPHLRGEAIQGNLMVSPDEALRSMQHIWDLIDREKATVLLHHDPDEWRSYKLVPSYYD